MNLRTLAFGLTVLFCSSALFAAAASPDEVKKQGEFKKGYGSQIVKDRLAAVEILADCTHPSTWSLLATVIGADADKEVRIAAYKELAAMPAHNAALAKTLAQLFTAAKMKDEKDTSELKQKFGEAAEKSEFKFDLGNAFTDYFQRTLRYPDLVISAQLSPKAQENAKEKIEADRKELEEFLGVLNKMFDTDVKNADKNSPTAIRKWWTANSGKFALADKQLGDKYAKEDIEAAKAAKDAAK